MKYELRSIYLSFLLIAGVSSSISAQFDDLYFNPETDESFYEETSYDNYSDVEYDDASYDDYDDDYYAYESGNEYYDDYDYRYTNRIRRFNRNNRSNFGYFSSCYVGSGFGFGNSLISINFGNPYGFNNFNSFNRWNRWNRFNRWNSWNSNFYANSYWGNGWGGYNNPYGGYGFNNGPFFGNGFGGNAYCPPGFNRYNNNNNNYFNSVVNNRYDRSTNPNGVVYGSRRRTSGVSSSNGKLGSPRGRSAGNITDGNNKTSNLTSRRRGDSRVSRGVESNSARTQITSGKIDSRRNTRVATRDQGNRATKIEGATKKRERTTTRSTSSRNNNRINTRSRTQRTKTTSTRTNSSSSRNKVSTRSGSSRSSMNSSRSRTTSRSNVGSSRSSSTRSSGSSRSSSSRSKSSSSSRKRGN